LYEKVKKILGVTLLGLSAAASGFFALLYGCGLLFRPDVVTPPPLPPADQLAAVQRSRELAGRLDRERPPVITRAVDYADLSAGWHPRGESPVLAELVREGRLPPVAQRVGDEPVVMEGVDGVGRYGGTWQRFANSYEDFKTIYWRLSGSNLVRWSPQGYPLVPHVAKSWEVSPDYRVYTFELRRGMRWSDGHPVSSDDLVYWYEHEIKYFNVRPKLLRAGATQGRVSKLDEWRVRFEFAQPNPLFLERLASTGMNFEDYSEHILPAHYLRSFHPALGDQATAQRLMGSLGVASPLAVYRRMRHYLNAEHPRLWPWVIQAAAVPSPLVLVRNPYYWAVDTQGNQLPYLDRVVLAIRTNQAIGVAAANGEISMQARHIRYDDHIMLQGEAARRGYEVYHWKPSTQSVFTVFPNLNRRVEPSRPETRWKSELLNQARFRQALSLAINRWDIIHAQFNGQGAPAQIAPPPDSPYHNARLWSAFTEFDPVRANRLLDELGLTRRDAEGFRTFADGSRMAFTLNATDYTTEAPGQFVIDDWARVGVRAIFRSRARRLFEQEKLAYEHDFTVWTGESEFYPLVEPRNFVPTYFESFFAPGFGWWYQSGGLHGDPASRRPNAIEPPRGHPLRRAMELLDETCLLTDEMARIARFNQIQEIAADNVWTISIATPPPQLVVVKNGFKNVPRTALFGANFQSPANAGLETYFWEEAARDHRGDAQTKAAILSNVGSRRAERLSADRPQVDPAPAIWGRLWLAGTGITLSLLLLRHPLILRRILLLVPTMLMVSVVVFSVVQLPPGDFVEMRIARLELEGTLATDELAAELRKNFRLDEPLTQRYARWMGFVWFTTFQPEDTGLLQGNLGLSMEHEKPAREVLGDRIFLTVLVCFLAVILAWALALPAGIYSAVRPYSPGDYGLTFVVFLGVSVPPFLFALVMMYLVRRWFGFNAAGLFSAEFATVPEWTWAKVIDLMKHAWLPVLVLAFGLAAGLVRVMRANLLDELKKPYVTAARAKGVRPLRLLLKYPVRLALNPFVSSIGGFFPHLVSGGSVVAIVLSLPMVGPTLWDALIAEDVYLAASLLMVLSLLGALGTLVSDLWLLRLDPRIRIDSGRR
jgi:ABC-type dipeptide/oligopeptide/nickel transport system permease component/ABC-type transport system substrate-binding protein